MLNGHSLLKKSWKLYRANYVIVLFGLIVVATLAIAGFKILTGETHTVYAKVKISQGLWWASTQRPPLWYAQSIKKGLTEEVGSKTRAEVIRVRRYPYWNSDAYDIVMIVRLEANKNEKTGEYTYNRETLSIASPIEFFFPEVHISGTITDISPEPFNDVTTEKEVTAIKYMGRPEEFDAIKRGAVYFDGEEEVLEIVDKNMQEVIGVSSDNDLRFLGLGERRVQIEVTLKLRVLEQNGNYLFGPEHVVKVGKNLNISTPSFVFDGFQVVQID